MELGLDTTVLIDLERDVEEAWAALASHEEARLTVPSVSVQEYLNGETPANSDRLRELLRFFTVLDHTSRAAEFGASAQRTRSSAGRAISMEDALIIGTLLAHGVDRILTRDATGFEGIEGIDVIGY